MRSVPGAEDESDAIQVLPTNTGCEVWDDCPVGTASRAGLAHAPRHPHAIATEQLLADRNPSLIMTDSNGTANDCLNAHS